MALYRSNEAIRICPSVRAMNSNPMKSRNPFLVFFSAAAIGTLGGLIGLGGAEFRLPLLIGVFGFGALESVILNKAMSLIVVMSALPFRALNIPFSKLAEHWDIVATLLAGSLVGAWFGAGWATRVASGTLYRALAVLLAGIAVTLLWGPASREALAPPLSGSALSIAGVAAGFGIGVIASVMGVAGGELLIPAIVLLFAIDIKLAGSLSLAVGLPTMLVGFFRYSRDKSFQVIRVQRRFIALMAIGSLAGVLAGGSLLGIVSEVVLLPGLAAILVISAFKVWRHA